MVIETFCTSKTGTRCLLGTSAGLSARAAGSGSLVATPSRSCCSMTFPLTTAASETFPSAATPTGSCQQANRSPRPALPGAATAEERRGGGDDQAGDEDQRAQDVHLRGQAVTGRGPDPQRERLRR